MKIRIDHYNLTKNEYLEFHQDLVDLTLDELIELFKKLPKKDDFPDNPVHIISKDYVFLKKTDNIIRIVPNITGLTFIPQMGDPFLEEKNFGRKQVVCDINNNALKSFILEKHVYKPSIKSILRNLFLTGFFPLINSILIIYTISIYKLNLGIIICLWVLLSLSIFALGSIIRHAFMKPIQFKQLKYELLILDKLKPTDLSQLILSVSQCFYIIIFIVFSLYLKNSIYQYIIWITSAFSLGLFLRNVGWGFFLIISLYLRARIAKELIQDRILSKYYDGPVDEKSHYLCLYNLMESEKLIRLGLLTKFITFITFSFTLISILIITL